MVKGQGPVSLAFGDSRSSQTEHAALHSGISPQATHTPAPAYLPRESVQQLAAQPQALQLRQHSHVVYCAPGGRHTQAARVAGGRGLPEGRQGHGNVARLYVARAAAATRLGPCWSLSHTPVATSAASPTARAKPTSTRRVRRGRGQLPGDRSPACCCACCCLLNSGAAARPRAARR